jgi:MFS family permease
MGDRLTTDRKLWRLILASALAMFLVNLDFFAVQVALPDMAKDLNSTIDSLQWVISGYMLSLAAFLIVGGRLADILGRKSWLILGTSIFGFSSLIGGFATSAEILIIMRILQGVGAAVLMPSGCCHECVSRG